ncbi:MAG: hypothetical protein DRG24_03335 [Epsilonproteobacteria bacterium]|nr:MAG: hypothetical protein DRG24_03335 [Campylobacterota bacterium]
MPLYARLWVKFFILSAFTLAFGVYSINYSVDPFGERAWLVEKRYKPIVYERSEKYNTIFYKNGIEKFDCLILGSSRVMTISPAQTPEISSCYNFGVHVANNAEKLFLLQSWLKYKTPKRLFLGLEYYNFHQGKNPLDLKTGRFKKGSEGNYFSLNTLKMSYKAFKNRLQETPQTFFNPDGSINYFKRDQEIEAGEFNLTSSYFAQQATNTIRLNFIDSPFIYETKAMQPLHKIKALCVKNGIILYPFLTPIQDELYQQLQVQPAILKVQSQIKKDLLALFPNLYDFSADHRLSRAAEQFYDPWHYRSSLATQMIKSMLLPNRE